MKRLLCSGNFEKIILDASKLSTLQLHIYLEDFTRKDTETKNKAIMLGMMEDEIQIPISRMIDEKHEPNFINLSSQFENGKDYFIFSNSALSTLHSGDFKAYILIRSIVIFQIYQKQP